MAKGAKKKTKWVSFSLASANATVPPTEQENASKLSRGLKAVVANDETSGNCIKSKILGSENSSESANISQANASDRRSSWSVNGNSRRRSSEGTNHTYSNGYHTQQPHRNYSSHYKSHYNRNSYHNGSSRKSHYSSYNDGGGGGGYRNNSSDQYRTSETKNEQNGTVIINDDEYTKITTPRQDVLFKKGYLSRPKNYSTTTPITSENGTTTASSSGNGTTDGSDGATGSGTVSTAESITSDSTYLTDGHFMEYPSPLPYFGYIDQSGVLVMNGFAIDNNGFSYMNGGQTYIYPPNYNCQSSLDVDDRLEEEVEQVDDAEALNVQNGDSDSVEAQVKTNGVITDESNLLEKIKNGSLEEQANVENVQSADYAAEDDQQPANAVEQLDDIDQQVPQQQPTLSPYENAYDYAQFYNAFYYPGCVIAPPFPVAVGNESYYDQFGVTSEEEHARQLSFRKRKKRNRHWEEYPTEYHPEGMVDTVYQYPNVFSCPDPEPANPIETPVGGDASEPSTIEQNPSSPSNPTLGSEKPSTVAAKPPSSQKVTEVPSQSIKPQNAVSAQKSSNRSQTSPPSAPTAAKQKTQSQKIRKKDIIESTRAFAEQNIDLTRPACLLQSNEARQDEANVWKTVRNGKEITVLVEEDRSVEKTAKVDAIATITKKPVEDKVFDNEKKSTELVTNCDVEETKVDEGKVPKKETSVKKGKKTAKGKGKKQRKPMSAQQQKGFQVTEPEFPSIKKETIQLDEEDDQEEVELSLEAECNDEIIENVEENANADSVDQIAEEEPIIETQTSFASNVESDIDSDEENLEKELQDIQLTDLQVNESCKCVENVNVEDEYKEDLSETHVEDDSVAQHNITVVQEACVNENETEITEESVKEEVIAVQQDACMTYNEAPCNDNSVVQDVVSDEQKDCVNDVPSTLSDEKREENLSTLCFNELTVDCKIAVPSNQLSAAEEPDSPLDDSKEDDDRKRRHFSSEEYSDNFDSGVQSPAAFVSSSNNDKQRKMSSSSYNDHELNVTDAVTKWLSETLSNKRLEEMFVLPEDPTLLHRIHQFNFMNSDDSIAMYSDTYSSSSGDEADDIDSDYMSDVQIKNRQVNNLDRPQKTESQKDQLTSQTANGHVRANGNHSNHKQKRCIIM